MAKDELVAELTQYFSRCDNIPAAYLFGSAARGEALHNSDIDVGVLFDATVSEYDAVQERIRIGQQLEGLLARVVDVVDLRRTPPHFNHHVLRHKVVVKGRSARERVQFEKDVRRHYFDMLPYRKRYLDASMARLREGGQSDGRRRFDSGTIEAARRIHKRLGERAGDQP